MIEETAAPKPGTLGVAWRAFVFIVASVGFATLGATILSGASRGAGKISVSFDSLPGVLLGVIAVSLATWAMLHTEKGLGWGSLYLDGPALDAKKIGFGLLLGAAGIGVPSAVLLVSRELGVRTTPAGNWISAAAFDAAFFALAATMEELVVRGYLFSLVRRQWGWKTALVSTSLLFGALHLLNPGADAESMLNVTLAGIFLAAVLLVTRSLYAAIAAHLAWNWTMAALFHSVVSGAAIPAPNYATVDNGPDWLTGGQWGPEGGAGATAAMLVLIFILYRMRRSRVES
ncbi:MAG: CPBP family intramembrane metalloprotease [Gemmatimonadota bacterium]|nr:CPBP family intramembrane metalloprotease [Gemmatimonadota bacterium]